jgi:hypothetical protein
MSQQPMDENHDAIDLLCMVAPERVEELQTLLKKYEPNFCAGSDKTGFVFQASPFGFIHFTNRTILHVWLMAWVMWKEMYCWSTFIYLLASEGKPFVLCQFEKIPDQSQSYADADALYAGALAFVRSEPMNWNLWPTLIPKPLDIALQGNEDRLIKDLVHHAIAFFLLHEFRHLILNKDGFPIGNPLDEEFECDRWATEYMLDCADVYATASGEDSVKVKSKRAMGGALGEVVIAHIQKLGLWETGAEHPPIAERMKRLTDGLDLPGNDLLWNVACSFLLASLRRQNSLPHRIDFQDQRDLFRKLLSGN